MAEKERRIFKSFEDMAKAMQPERKQDLSDESIEKVMSKVKNINETGTAFSIILTRDPIALLPKILSVGLIGQRFPNKRAIESEDVAELKRGYVEDLKSDREPVVHFNVVGRMGTTIAESQYVRQEFPPVVLGVIFDAPSEYPPSPRRAWTPEEKEKYQAYEEQVILHRWMQRKTTPPPDISATEGRKQKINTFTAATSGGDRMGDDRVDDEYGFVLRGRIAPRRMRGLILRLKREEKKISRNAYTDQPYEESAWVEETDQTKRAQLLQRVVSTMIEACKGGPDALLPIYDPSGNLLWPKQVDVAEIEKIK